MDAITGFLEEFDFAKLLPELGKFLSGLRFWIGFVMLLGPVVLLICGLRYYYRPVQIPDRKRGYYLPCAMYTKAAWKFTQRTAGVVWSIAGGAMAVIGLLICLILIKANEMTLVTVAVIWMILEVVAVLVSNMMIRRKVNSCFDRDGMPIE